MKEFIVFTLSLIWFILSGVLAAIIATYLHLPHNWILYLSLALIIAFTPFILVLKYKKKQDKIQA